MLYTRALKYTFPLISGEDVLELQRKLKEVGYLMASQPDGIFGIQTDSAVRTFQQTRGLKVDGVVGPLTWNVLFEDRAKDLPLEKVKRVLGDLKQPHRYQDSVEWHLSHDGIVIDSQPTETSGGEPKTVRRVWNSFSKHIEEWGAKFAIPLEIIIATICTESSGDPLSIRTEPGYVSDVSTPDKVSPGLMQTLISTARNALADNTINRAWLLEPGNSIRAGTAYIASQWKTTNLDPPKAACAYNAGGLYYNASPGNRWKMRQYPINSSQHADRFIKWFNDCYVMFKEDNLAPTPSFYRLIREYNE